MLKQAYKMFSRIVLKLEPKQEKKRDREGGRENEWLSESNKARAQTVRGTVMKFRFVASRLVQLFRLKGKNVISLYLLIATCIEKRMVYECNIIP